MNPVGSPSTRISPLDGLGRGAAASGAEAMALLGFIGESSVALGRWVAHPSRIRWRPLLSNIDSAGVGALPIIGLLSFLLGIVVAYQGSDQLSRNRNFRI